MSFFGTSTPAKPGGIFASFGAGSFGNTSTTTAPAFGAATAPAFGATSTAPAFGATSAPAFGATSTAPAFGTPAFGTTSTAPAFGSTSGFGGFGATATTAPTFFGSTSAANTNTVFSGFGNTATSFGGFGSTATNPGGFGGFGAQQPTGAFGSTFGKPATSTVTPGFGGFGGNTNFMLGQPQQQPPQISSDEAFANSITRVSIYGDERDTTIAKWNFLQAMWGTGKSFYSQNAAHVDITPQNCLCRFKVIGYSRLPDKDNKMGLVALNFNKSVSELRAQRQQIINSLNGVMGSRPNLILHIESTKDIEEKKSQLIIYVEEKSQFVPNETKRISATDMSNFLNQPNIRGQLNNIGVIDVLALVLPDEDQLKQYLENPPKGIDARLWRQANVDNPDPTKFIPVPMIGFSDLKWRIKCQENETETHALYLKKVERDLAEIKQRYTSSTAKIMEHKRKLAELSHKILKIIVKQECTRKVGLSLTPEEEALRTKLECMQAIVSAPTQFKGRLSELLSQMRMQRNQYALTGGSEYTIDKDAEDEMKTFLAMQQKAMEVLTDTVTKDMKVLQIIIDGMPQLIKG